MRPVEIERGFQLTGQAVTDGSKYAMVPNGTASEVVWLMVHRINCTNG